LAISTDHIITVSPLGDMDTGFLEPIQIEIERIFGYPTEIHEIPLDLSFAFDPKRNQYHSTVILEILAELMPFNSLKIVAVTRVDLYIPILTYVFGEAQLGGKACIISTHRLNEPLCPTNGINTWQHRAVKEAIHELGHTFNLRHCPEKKCIMHYCRSLKDVDRKRNDMCRYCKVLLGDEQKKYSPA
jgi:archaemetzincin